nr:uncharacterized protein LOC111860661 isoform X1 [Paramormyrops kingsleyae]
MSTSVAVRQLDLCRVTSHDCDVVLIDFQTCEYRGQSHLSSRSPTGGDRDEGLTTEMQVVETQSKSLCTDMTTKEEKSAGEVMKMREKDEHSEQESASINKSVQHQYFQSLTSQGVSLKCQDPEGDGPHDQHPKVEHFLGQPVQYELEDRDRLSVLTWNLDGLDSEDLLRRAGGLFSNIKKYRPDVLLLQELVPEYLHCLKKHFVNYTFLQGSDEDYFSGIMLRKSRVQLLHSNIVKFRTTSMGRNLLLAYVSFFGRELCVMTSHLESCKTSYQERQVQLTKVWTRMREVPKNVSVIFGGDTNLRDKEVSRLGGLPEGICDVWEALGEPEDCRYTWDTETNDNKDIPHSVRLRFDRVFLQAARDGPAVTPESMELIGQERLSCGYFTSDHWGILCAFTVGPEVPTNKSSCKRRRNKRREQMGINGGESHSETMSGQVLDGDNVKKGLSLQGESSQSLDSGAETPQDPGQQTECFLGHPVQCELEEKDKLTVLTWNLDGHDQELKRLGGLFSNIKKYRPEIILLQEFKTPYLRFLMIHFKNYHILTRHFSSYFTCIMLRKSRVQLLSYKTVKLPSKTMQRDLLMAHVKFCGRELYVMTSHLIYGKENSQERLDQIGKVWTQIREAPDNVAVIFGGDTNLRDWEVNKLGGPPEGISDVWEALGKPEDCRYTWDMETNDNKDIPKTIRMRLDRIFTRASTDGAAVVPKNMALIGQERLNCGLFASDHWGVLCDFTVKPQDTPHESTCKRPPEANVKEEEKKEGDEMKKNEEEPRSMSNHDKPSKQPSKAARMAISIGNLFKEHVEDKDKLTVLSWSLDGLDEGAERRCGGLLRSINKYQPDIILLQEVIPLYLAVLGTYFWNYEILPGSDDASSTCIMLKKYRVRLLRSDVVNYPTTEMNRNLLMAYVNFYGRELCVMTSHLESGKENSQERMNQLRRVWKRMREAPDDVTVIFGGDTNLRDWEVIKLGGAPVGILDVWETLGKPEDCSYTWISTGRDDRNPVRIRFDRIFLRPPGDGAALVPEKMSLAVLGRPQCRAFGSTHWGVLCDFAVSP